MRNWGYVSSEAFPLYLELFFSGGAGAPPAPPPNTSMVLSLLDPDQLVKFQSDLSEEISKFEQRMEQKLQNFISDVKTMSAVPTPGVYPEVERAGSRSPSG